MWGDGQADGWGPSSCDAFLQMKTAIPCCSSPPWVSNSEGVGGDEPEEVNDALVSDEALERGSFTPSSSPPMTKNPANKYMVKKAMLMMLKSMSRLGECMD